MAKMRREISYHEAKPGVFERAPTRAEIRKAEKAREGHIEKIGICFLVALVAFIFGVDVWAVLR